MNMYLSAYRAVNITLYMLTILTDYTNMCSMAYRLTFQTGHVIYHFHHHHYSKYALSGGFIVLYTYIDTSQSIIYYYTDYG